MRVRIPFSQFVLFIGLMSLTFLIIMFFEEPFEGKNIFYIVLSLGALIFIPLGIKFLKEDIDRQNRPRF